MTMTVLTMTSTMALIANTASAQTIPPPCYTAAECHVLRERHQAEVEAQRQEAIEVANAQRAREVAKEEADKAAKLARERAFKLKNQVASLLDDAITLMHKQDQAYLAQVLKEAEDSPDNYCKVPKMAADLLSDMTTLLHQQGLTDVSAVDIHHLITVGWSKTDKVCHGDFIFSNGNSEEGTLTYHLNVADQVIVSFNPG